MKASNTLISAMILANLVACGAEDMERKDLRQAEQGLNVALRNDGDGFRLTIPNPATLGVEGSDAMIPQEPNHDPLGQFDFTCIATEQELELQVIASLDLKLVASNGDVTAASYIFDCAGDASIAVKELRSGLSYRLEATLNTNPKYQGVTSWFSLDSTIVDLNMKRVETTGSVDVRMNFEEQPNQIAEISCYFEGVSFANGCLAIRIDQDTDNQLCFANDGSAASNTHECNLKLAFGTYRIESVCGDEVREVKIDQNSNHLTVMFQGCDDAVDHVADEDMEQMADAKATSVVSMEEPTPAPKEDQTDAQPESPADLPEEL